MSSYTQQLDDRLTAAVLARYGAGASVSIVPYLSRDWGSVDREPWYVLSIKRDRLDDWHVIGRRRTKAELVSLIETPNAGAAF